MKHLFYYLFSLTLALCGTALAQTQTAPHTSTHTQAIDLTGVWQFQIDRTEVGVEEKWYDRRQLNDTITLPGSMPQRHKGDVPTVHTQWTGSLYDSSFYFNPALEAYRRDSNLSLPFFLTPDRHYVGVAWYNREVTLPKDWNGQRITLNLERPHIQTTVYANGRRVGSQNSLCTAHQYDLTDYLRPGRKNLLSIRIDNTMRDVPVGIDSHSVTDQTQGNWNGIVGDITLTASSPLALTDDGDYAAIEVYPNITEKKARVRLSLRNLSRQTAGVQLRLSADAFNTTRTGHAETLRSVTVKASDTARTVVHVDLEGLNLLWDEFTPTLYRLTVDVLDANGRRQLDTRTLTFGMREVKAAGKWIYVNGRKTLLRGTVENCDFPLTGYAPMDTASWMRVFRICKEYGLNHMRFHSYCPPEAAFIAADMVGFYLQPEGPSWPNHGVKLGRKEPIDTYLMDETRRITRSYGNHPSFALLSAGNEPAGNWVPWATAFVDYWKVRDTRRLYTGFSVGGGWAWQPHNQYHVKAGVRGLDWGRRPESQSDFSAKIDTVRAPFICHELGQWCAFPDFKEIDRYTGVNKAKNFEMFRDILRKNDMGDLAEKFLMASGRLQVLCYKHELEKLYRTKDYAGFQMLALNDYSGQGTALEGVLNVFFENKGYVTAEEFRQFCNTTVPLMRTAKFVYRSDEVLSFELEVAHFGSAPIERAVVYYLLYDDKGHLVRHFAYGKPGDPFYPLTIPIGGQNRIGSMAIPLSHLNVSQAEKLTLIVGVYPCKEGTPLPDMEQLPQSGFHNTWNLWVYPAEVQTDAGDVYVTDSLDDRARQTLADGGDVLITAGGKVSYGRDIKQYFTPVFWNTSWFKMRPPHTTGIYLDATHPAFAEFPTEDHSDLQWWELLQRTQVMLFTDFPQGFQPLVQSIDTWFLSRKIGVLFEARVGKGRLMMTTMDLTSDLGQRVVARQMRHSLLDYMNSDRFNPTYTVDVERVADLFTKVAPPIDSYTTESPDELKPGYEKNKK
jgi:hypothetical protein